MSAYLPEAAQLAAETPCDRCPATDQLEILDANPHLRLALEDTWTGDAGRVYREVPADRVSRWPAHLARLFRPLLRIGREPKEVIQLLDLLHALDAGAELAQVTLKGCHKRQALKPAIAYYERLNGELAEVTRERPGEEITLGTRELQGRLRVACGEVQTCGWLTPESDGEDARSPSYRVELLHDPSAPNYFERDWIWRQPKAYRRLYYTLSRAKASALPAWKERLLSQSTGLWDHSQAKVLWEAYQLRRDYFRKRHEVQARGSLRPTGRKLLRRISKINSTPELGYVGKCLYEAMKGNIELPGPVSQPEWAIVFEAYRARKSALIPTSL